MKDELERAAYSVCTCLLAYLLAPNGGEAPIHNLRNLADLFDHFGEGFGFERLFAIRNGVGGIHVNFHNQAIGSGSDGGAGDGGDII